MMSKKIVVKIESEGNFFTPEEIGEIFDISQFLDTQYNAGDIILWEIENGCHLILNITPYTDLVEDYPQKIHSYMQEHHPKIRLKEIKMEVMLLLYS